MAFRGYQLKNEMLSAQVTQQNRNDLLTEIVSAIEKNS
jgi:hypothetical protein